jgi:TonB family protein
MGVWHHIGNTHVMISSVSNKQQTSSLAFLTMKRAVTSRLKVSVMSLLGAMMLLFSTGFVLQNDIEWAGFPGGEAKMNDFIKNNLRYPTTALKHQIEGQVWVTFKVDETGRISDVAPKFGSEKRLGYGLEEEAVRLIQIMPHWIPQKRFGKPESSICNLMISFTIL